HKASELQRELRVRSFGLSLRIRALLNGRAAAYDWRASWSYREEDARPPEVFLADCSSNSKRKAF
ncbi:MAG: hypothetical protein ABI624_12460, partial [Casimicrobiaceae bacterium]